MRDPQTGLKLLTAPKLIELLASLPPEARVGVNAVGNLLVVDPAGGYTGYIDFGDECFEQLIQAP